MYKVILLMLLAVVSSSAMAEWVALDISSDFFVVYADPATISRRGSIVEMLSLIDHKTVIKNAGMTYMSIKAQHEFDCVGAQVRMLFSSTHSENMGRGEIVNSNYKPDSWQLVQPLSIAETLWKFACGKN